MLNRKDMLGLIDVTGDEIYEILDTAANMKKLIKEIKLLEIQLEDAEEASGKPKTCAFCGAKNSCDNTFCAKCGEKL